MDIAENEKRTGAARVKKVPNPEGVVRELEARCAELGLKVIYDDLRGEGGVCRVHNRLLVIINRRCSAATKIRILEQALRRAGQQLTAPTATPQERAQPVVNPAPVPGKTHPD
jgi:hypothetical protein